MALVSNYSGLVRSIKSTATAALTATLEDISPSIEDILRRRIKSVVYVGGEPHDGAWLKNTTYERSYNLLDEISSEIIEDSGRVILRVTSDAEPSDPIVKGCVFEAEEPGAFLRMIENGDMGFLKAEKHGYPRPVITRARDDVYRKFSKKKINALVQERLG